MDALIAQIQAPNQPFETGLSDRYDDPQYHNTIQVSASGVYTLQVTNRAVSQREQDNRVRVVDTHREAIDVRF